MSSSLTAWSDGSFSIPESLLLQLFTENEYRQTYYDDIQVKATPGSDCVDYRAFEAHLNEYAADAMTRVHHQKYRFRPYLGQLISKGFDKKPRLVETPTIRDKVTLRIVHRYLTEYYKDDLRSRTLHSQVRRLCKILDDGEDLGFMRYDIANFYPSINQAQLLKTLENSIRDSQIISLIKNAIRTPSDLFKQMGKHQRTEGVPQGLSISGVLANAYLTRLDQIMSQFSDVEYLRYVDDILLVGRRDALQRASNALQTGIQELHLKLGHDKTQVGRLGDPLEYLGYSIDGDVVSVRESTINRLCDSVANIVVGYQRRRQHRRHSRNGDARKQLLFRLNLRITGGIFDEKRYGWLFYFSRMNDVQKLYGLDATVRRLCKKHGVPPNEVKSFVKALHAIQKNLRPIGYIPDFDNYSTDQKREVLSWYGIRYDGFDDDDIERRFRRLVYKETSRLERDMAGFS